MPITRRTYPQFRLTNKTPITVKRYAKGEWVNGRWVEGEAEEIDFEANVQPMQFKELMLLPESDRIKEWIKVYSVEPFRTADESTTGNDADEILWDGFSYKVMKCKHYQMGVLDHYCAYAAREPVSAGYSL